MPSTTDVVTVRRDMMTMIETKTNDAMKKTENTMDDASECAPKEAAGARATTGDAMVERGVRRGSDRAECE